MDSDKIRYLLGKFFHMKFFYGVFAADNFLKLAIEGFIIVNASPAYYERSNERFFWFTKTMFIWLIRLEYRYKTIKYKSIKYKTIDTNLLPSGAVLQ